MHKRTIKIMSFIIVLALLIFGTYRFGYTSQFTSNVAEYLPISVTSSSTNKQLQNGDIIFQTSTSSQSKAIQLATNSKYSHMGIIYNINEKLFVYEAIQPVKLTPFNDWINRGENGHYVVKRLKNAEQQLTPALLTKMKQVGDKFRGKNYDLYFEWSNDRIYCSELVWKIYKEATGIEIGKLERLSDFDLSSPLVQQKMKERYGNQVPMNELVISPVAMFKSNKLETVLSK